MLPHRDELERAYFHEGIMDIFHSPVIFGSVGSEVDNFLFIEEFFEMSKYCSDLETANLGNLIERESLFEIDKSLMVWWNLFS